MALQNPDLFQGDILGIDPDDRNVIPHTQMRWTNGVIPYVIDWSLSGAATNLINAAINHYHQTTCLRFVQRTSERNYVRMFKGQGCYSYIGMIGGAQDMSHGDGCLFVGTIVHEIGHAIGFFHEQNRSDRDTYLIIYWQNIQSGMESQFSLLKPHENLLLNSFDHGSIMLYGNYAFSRDGRSLTMVAKNGQKLLEPYDRPGMTQSDIQRVKQMYNCR